MSRREEIELACFSKMVQSNHKYDEKTFKEAVEWADKTMIEKACRVLDEMTEGRLGKRFLNEYRKHLEK